MSSSVAASVLHQEAAAHHVGPRGRVAERGCITRRDKWANIAARSAPSSWFKQQGGAHARIEFVENAGLERPTNKVECLSWHVDNASTICIGEDSVGSSKGLCDKAQGPINAQVRLPPCPGMEELHGLSDCADQEGGEREQEREIGRCHQHHEHGTVDIRNRWAEARPQTHSPVQDQTMSRRSKWPSTLCSQHSAGEPAQGGLSHTPRNRSCRGFCVAWYSPPKRVGEDDSNKHRVGEGHASNYVNETENDNKYGNVADGNETENDNKYGCEQPNHMGSNSASAVPHVESLDVSQVSVGGTPDRECENNETEYDLRARPPKFQIAVRTSKRMEADIIDKPVAMLHARSSKANTMWDLHATTSRRMAKYYEDGLIAAPKRTTTTKQSESSETPLTRAKSLPNIISMLNLVEGGVGPQSEIQLRTNKRNRAKGKAKAKAKTQI